jgi:transcriptional regulator with XRE-family HTH domain
MTNEAPAQRAPHVRPTRRTPIDHALMRATRVRLGKNYSSLARQIGSLGYDVTPARIGQIERGDEPSPELFPFLCRALGLREDELKK